MNDDVTDMINQEIKVRSRDIRAKLKDALLYGVPIDMNNEDMVLVAVWDLAMSHTRHRVMEELDRLLKATI